MPEYRDPNVMAPDREKQRKKNRERLAAIAALTLIVVGGAVGGWWWGIHDASGGEKDTATLGTKLDETDERGAVE